MNSKSYFFDFADNLSYADLSAIDIFTLEQFW